MPSCQSFPLERSVRRVAPARRSAASEAQRGLFEHGREPDEDSFAASIFATSPVGDLATALILPQRPTDPRNPPAIARHVVVLLAATLALAPACKERTQDPNEVALARKAVRGPASPATRRPNLHRPIPPPASDAATTGVFFAASFEHRGLAPFDLSWLHNTWAAKVVTRVARGGTHALEISLRRRDAMASKGKRAEIMVPFTYRRHASYWYGLSVYLPKTWRPDFKGDVIAQWFAHEDRHLGEHGRSPALALRIRDRFWFVTYRWDDRPVTRKNRGHKGKIFKAPYATGSWTDWVFHVRWSYDPHAPASQRGFVEVYKDGVKVATREGPNTYNDRVGPSLKLGIYKAPWNDPEAKSAVSKRLLYLDEIRVGGEAAGYAGVAPRPHPK